MSVDADNLVARLASWLSNVVPPQVSVGSKGTDIQVWTKGQAAVPTVIHVGSILAQPNAGRQEVEYALISALSGVQDFVIRELKERWPSAPRNIGKSEHRELPMPEAEVGKESIRAWYGDKDNPILSFRLQCNNLNMST